MSNTPADLFAALIGAPSLPGAACAGRWSLFDAPEPGADPDDAAYRQQVALRLCRTCPALTRCAEWVDSLPKSKRPTGVIAGQLHTPRTVGRPASTTRKERKTA